MEKRHFFGFRTGTLALLTISFLLFFINIFMYAYFSPSVKVISGKAGEDQGVISIRILPAGVLPEVPTPAPSAGSPGGGGAGGSTPTSKEIIENGAPFKVTPESLSVSLVVGEKVIREIIIENRRSQRTTIKANVEFLSKLIGIDKEFTLEAGEKRVVSVNVGPTEKGLLTGRIVFSSGPYSQAIPVVINAKSRNFLFDVSIIVPDKYKIITPGTKLPAEINLLQIGEHAKVDVTVSYVVKDFSGIIYIEEGEIVSVFDSKSYAKTFATDSLPPGKYIVGMEVQYPGAFATSSAQFEVTEEKKSGIAFYFSLASVVLVAISIIIILLVIIKQRLSDKKNAKRAHRKV